MNDTKDQSKKKEPEPKTVVLTDSGPGHGAQSPRKGLGGEISARLRGLLLKREMSARFLSKAAGLADAHLSILMRRLDQNPDAEVEVGTLIALADAAKVSFAWLVTGRNDAQGERLCDLPDWGRYVDFIEENHKSVPRWALDDVGRFVLPKQPEHIEFDIIIQIARAWVDANPQRFEQERERERRKWARTYDPDG